MESLFIKLAKHPVIETERLVLRPVTLDDAEAMFEYASDKDKWGQFDPKRWNAFYAWAKEQGLVSNDLEDKGFTNELVGD